MTLFDKNTRFLSSACGAYTSCVWYGLGRAEEKGKLEHFEKAFSRLLELMDLILSDTRYKGTRLRELARMRETMCHALTENDEVSVKLIKSFKKDFQYYAMVARNNIK